MLIYYLIILLYILINQHQFIRISFLSYLFLIIGNSLLKFNVLIEYFNHYVFITLKFYIWFFCQLELPIEYFLFNFILFMHFIIFYVLWIIRKNYNQYLHHFYLIIYWINNPFFIYKYKTLRKISIYSSIIHEYCFYIESSIDSIHII